MPPLTAAVLPSSVSDFERRAQERRDQEPRDPERRVAQRQPSQCEALTHSLDAEVELAWGATVRDISTSGIGLTLCYPFPAGSYLAVDLDLPESRGPAPSLLARVVHAQDMPDGMWQVGCEFVKPLTEGELELVL